MRKQSHSIDNTTTLLLCIITAICTAINIGIVWQEIDHPYIEPTHYEQPLEE